MRSKSIELALYSEGYLPLLLCFTLYLRANSKYKPPGLYLEGRFNGAFFAYIWRGLYMEGLIFGILRYLSFQFQISKNEREICEFENGF